MSSKQIHFQLSVGGTFQCCAAQQPLEVAILLETVNFKVHIVELPEPAFPELVVWPDQWMADAG